MKKIVIYCTGFIVCAAIVAGGLGFAFKPIADEAPNAAVEGIKPFSSQAGIGSNYYRIPSLITARDGTLVAAMDARFGGTHDSPNNLDTAVSVSKNNGQNWEEPILAFHYNDWEASKNLLEPNGRLITPNSASTIDPSLLEDKRTGRIFMLVDSFPYGVGSYKSKAGNGYTTVDGEACLALRKKGQKRYNYTLRSDNYIYDQKGNKTKYSVNSNFEILEDGTPLTVKQKKIAYWYKHPFEVKTKTEIPMNIMYQASLFQAFPTTYLLLKYSDDSGQTWSDPINLNGQVKPQDAAFMGVCPGRGIQVENGDYAGRLIFPIYHFDLKTNAQRFASIYSDDNGATWQAGEAVVLDEAIGNVSETQLIEYPDGSLGAFSRTQGPGKVGYSFSEDGGVTWKNSSLINELPLTGGTGCQVSAINYKGKIDGKDAVLLSAPSRDNRKNGYIYVGLINETNDSGEPYEIEWKYKKEITGEDVYFAYSCLTQLENGVIGILYEQANTPQTVDTTIFKTFSVEELCQE